MRGFLLLISLVAVAPVILAFTQDTTGQEEPESQPVTVTGVVERPDITTYMYGTHSLTDEATNTLYALEGEEDLLDSYTGSRVTVYGSPVSGYEDGAIEGGPPLLDVTRVEPGVDLNEDGSVDEADGEFAAKVSDAARVASREEGQPTLPVTGGLPVLLLGSTLLLPAMALLAHRILR